MLLRRPQNLAAKHVADPARHLLIEERFGDRRIEIAVPAERFDRRVLVGRWITQIGARPTVARVAMRVELAIGLDGASAEANGCEAVNRDPDPELSRRLSPPLAGAVQVPHSAEQKVGVQDQTVVPHDVELHAMALNEFDHPAGRGHRTGEMRCLERQHGPSNQGRSQRCGRAANCFPLGHSRMVVVGCRNGAAWSPVSFGACRHPRTMMA